MKPKLFIAVGPALFFLTVVLGGMQCVASSRAQNPDVPQSQQEPGTSDSDTQMFGGRITKSNGAYVLRASSGKTSFMLDDQKTAKHYEGKIVVVTGTMDKINNLIHVQKIEAVA